MAPSMTAETALEIRDKIHPILQGYPPEIQGAALCDLLATWLAGHIIMDNSTGRPHATRTRKLREAILKEHIAQMRKLIPVNEEDVLERMRSRT